MIAATPKKKINWGRDKNPFVLIRKCWPKLRLYKQEEDLIRSVWRNDKTICVAGNMLGKDFTAALIVLVFFLTRDPCRVITTSVDETQLEGVLWGEIRNLINESAIPLLAEDGGPLIVNHLHIRKAYTSGLMKGKPKAKSYIKGKVAKKGESFLGHHAGNFGDGIPRTLFVADEASGIDDTSFDKVETWAARQLYIGNPYECTNAFFKESEAGDVVNPDTKDLPEDERLYYRKIIRITGHQSPNVRYAKEELRAKGKISGKMLIPGVLPYYEYKKRLATWDPIRISVSIDAQFYKGAELLLFPPGWLDRSHKLHREIKYRVKYRVGRAIGCDPGEGEAETAWYVVDEWGILDEVAYKTPNTADINKRTLALMKKWQVEPEMVMYDRGGGGLQCADALRDSGYPVKTVAFGESVQPAPKRGMTTIKHKIEQMEEAYVFVNRRAEMYGRASMLMDPSLSDVGFAIPDHCLELRRQLALMPKKYDKEGRLYLPPKNKKDPKSKEKTLIDIIGCSPDRADALVVALYCRDYSTRKVTAGAA